jgi:hypothetical protein
LSTGGGAFFAAFLLRARREPRMMSDAILGGNA